MNKKPLVSFLCATYNQKDFIAQTIEGFLMQKVDFPIEIIIHDDASTDGTAEIIKSYEARHPDLIKGIYQTENQYSQKKSVWNNFIYPLAKGKYYAECEGDDYWTDPSKIQRQVHFLRNNPEYILSTENANILFTDTGIIQPFSCAPEHDVSLEDLLIKRRFPTASVLYRSEIIEEFLKSNHPCFDTAMWAYLATKGKIHFNPIISSVYRRGCGVTETNKIKWAYTSERFNNNINKFFKPNKRIKQARKKTLFNDFKQGLKAAKAQHKWKDFFILLYKTITLNPVYFVKDLLKRKGRYYAKEFILPSLANLCAKAIPAKVLRSSSNNPPIVVSLTSYPARFPTLHLCLKSLFNQTLQPDKIILYLDKNVSFEQIPHKILKLQKKGLVIRNICEDIKPHKKYYYAMQEHPDSVIITADDDVIYTKDCVQSLFESYIKYPDCVSARRVHRITRHIDGSAAPYKHWQLESREQREPSLDLLAIGVGGVLYPPHILLNQKLTFNIENIKKICLNADDIWLKFTELSQGIRVRWVPNKTPHPYPIKNEMLKETGLRQDNLENNKNDCFIEKCQEFFNIKL